MYKSLDEYIIDNKDTLIRLHIGWDQNIGINGAILMPIH